VRGIRVALLLLPAVSLVLHSSPALAATFAKVSAPTTYASATLLAPTGLTVTKNCTNLTVTLNWTATTSMYATGYMVMYTTNGTSQTPLAISGRTTTTATYPIVRGATYNLTFAATYRSWTSLSNPTAGPLLC